MLFVDACDYGWGCTLAQPVSKGGVPAPICIFSKSFNPTEQAWSTFERELYGIRESLAAVDQSSGMVIGNALGTKAADEHSTKLLTKFLKRVAYAKPEIRCDTVQPTQTCSRTTADHQQ